MGEEIELKLEMTAADAAVLEASGALQGLPEIAQLRAIYFDTPDLVLANGGLSLRIRRSGRKRVQTIKADDAGAAGLFTRTEWERPVRNDIPILDAATPLPSLLGDKAETLAPIFVVQVERRRWIVAQEGATIEVVLDRGEVIAGERRSPICELELELNEGARAALFALARRINAITPVRLAVLSKAERGHALARELAKAVKAERLPLASDTTAAQAFQAVVQACIRHFRQNEALLLVTRDAQALHQARVALRRLRSAFTIFKPLIGTVSSAALREDLRWLAGVLGDARNLDMLLAHTRPGLLHDAVLAARNPAYDRVDAALQSARGRALMLDLVEWTMVGDWLRMSDRSAARQQSASAFAAHALHRMRRQVRQGGHAIVHGDDKARHEVRKDAKKLRYAAEFFASLFDSKHAQRRYGRFISALGHLQDHLGALNDIATTQEMLAQLGIADVPGASRRIRKRKKKLLLTKAADAHDELMDIKRFWR